MLNATEMYKLQRLMLGEHYYASCITIKTPKKHIYKDWYFPLVLFGSMIAFFYANDTKSLDGIKQDFSYEFQMDDGKLYPVVDFIYKADGYIAYLANLSIFENYGIEEKTILDILLIIRDGYCVYKYIDNDDGIVKYVGITKSMYQRYKQHCRDKLQGHDWTIAFIDGLSKTEAEILESHYISEYGTEKYYNKAKIKDGICRFLNIPESTWRLYVPSNKWRVARDVI